MNTLSKEEEIIRSRQIEFKVSLPTKNFPWNEASLTEPLVGLCEIPIGIAGPINTAGNESILVPLATTERALIASVNRGCKVINHAHTLDVAALSKGITRGPVIHTRCVGDAIKIRAWIAEDFFRVKTIFDSFSPRIQLQQIQSAPIGRLLYIRIRATCHDAMGMNMITRATKNFIERLQKIFPNHILESVLSANYCADKKQTANNWVSGRGNSVTAEVAIPFSVVSEFLHCSANDFVRVHHEKCLVGTAMAGGFPGSQNGQAANVVAALFAACGQDIAHVVSTSACLTNAFTENEALIFSIYMPIVEVGIVGGGTGFPSQKACLELILRGLKDPTPEDLAKRVCLAVMAGELSLLGSLAEGSLVSAHARFAPNKVIAPL